MSAEPRATVGSLSLQNFRSRLRGDGLGLRIGIFDVRLRSAIADIDEPLHVLYAHYPLLDGDRVFSCHVALERVRGFMPGRGSRVRFLVDGNAPQEDEPLSHALAILEWGLNLVIAFRFGRFLMLHAAALERNGRVLLMPAAPGDGKTTLCAALAHRGWRLLSDEFGIVRPETRRIVPVPRPMPLKNESIGIIRRFAPEAVFGPSIAGTRKGTVAHVRPPASSVERARDEAPIGWIVFPRWSAGAALRLEDVGPAETFMRLARNAFNYELLGATAFEVVRDLVQAAPATRLEYSDLDEAVRELTERADADGR